MSMILAQSFMKQLRTLSAADQQVVSVTIMALHSLAYTSDLAQLVTERESADVAKMSHGELF